MLLTGFVHGTWTQRWHPSAEVDAAVGRLDAIPTQVGDWTAGDAETIEPEVLKAAGAQGCWMRSFTSAATGQKVLVVVLCGHTGKMCVHRPENCYPGQGYDLAAAPLHQAIKMANGSPDAEFWTARFAKPEVTTGERAAAYLLGVERGGTVEGAGVSALDVRVAAVSVQALRDPRAADGRRAARRRSRPRSFCGSFSRS